MAVTIAHETEDSRQEMVCKKYDEMKKKRQQENN
jgi:hypothetical protein